MSKIYYDYVVYGDMNQVVEERYSYLDPAFELPFEVIQRSMYEGRHYPAPKEKVLNEEFIVAGPFEHKDLKQAKEICYGLNEQWREKNKFLLQKYNLYDLSKRIETNQVAWSVLESKAVSIFNIRKNN